MMSTENMGNLESVSTIYNLYSSSEAEGRVEKFHERCRKFSTRQT
ncbi:MAG: hypothetical protein WC592_01020 [Candidatus Omnitrophota bacterium]